jgi:WD40 repeat protein
MSRFPAYLILAGLLNVLPLIPVAAQPAPDQYGDPLPPGARARLGTVRFRHGGPVAFVAFSPDGKVVASSMGNGFFSLWEAATGRQLRRLPGQLQGVTSAAFSPDGKSVVLVANDGRVCLRDVATGKELRRLTTPATSRWQVALAPDGKTVALLDSDGSLRLWDVAADKERHRLLGPPAKGKGGQPGFVPGILVFSADGKQLALGGVQGQDVIIRVWDVFTGRERPALTGPPTLTLPGNLSCLVFSPDGKTLVVGDAQQGRVTLLDAATGAKFQQLAAQANGQQVAAAFSPDGKLLAVVNGVGVDLVDPATGQTVRRLPCPGQGFACLAFSPDGKALAVGGADHIVHLWEVATGKEIRPPDGHQGAVTATASSPDGRIVATTGWDHTVRLWDAATGKERRRLSRPVKAEDQARLAPPLLAFLRGGRAVAAAWPDGVVYVWETATGKELLRGRVGKEGSRPVAFAPDGKALATLGPDGVVYVHDVLAGRQLRRFPGRSEQAPGAGTRLAVAFGPDGRTLAIGYGAQGRIADGTSSTIYFSTAMAPQSGGGVRLWELTSGRERGQFALENSAPMPLLIDSGGTILNRRGLNVPVLNPVTLLALSPDGRTLAAVLGGTLRLWDLEGQRELRRLNSGYLGGGLAFSPDGRLLALGGSAGFQLWDVATGGELCRIGGHRGEVTSLAFSPDGKLLVSGASDTTALAWEVKHLLEEGRRQRVEPSPQRLEELWADLAHADAARAYRAVWALAAAPAQSVPFLGARLRAVPAVDGKKLARLVAELNHGRYAVRQQAVRDLEALGDVAEAALRAALEDGPTLELRRRVEPLLAKLEGPVTAPELLRALRAVEALERAGTAEARAVLARLAGGAPPARLTREAQDALKRLDQRRAAAP